MRDEAARESGTVCSKMYKPATVYDGVHYLDLHGASTAEELARIAVSCGHTLAEGALVVHGEDGVLTLYDDPEDYYGWCQRCGERNGECTCTAEGETDGGGTDEGEADEHDDSQGQDEQWLQELEGTEDTSRCVNSECSTCGDADCTVITTAYREGYYGGRADDTGPFRCSRCREQQTTTPAVPCSAECVSCGEDYHWVLPHSYLSGAYHVGQSVQDRPIPGAGDFRCATCALEVCDTCGVAYTPKGFAAPFNEDGSFPPPTWGFKAGSHRKCEGCWKALANGQAAPVAAPAAAKRARDRDSSAQDNRARNERDIKKLQRAFRGHCSHHLFYYWIKGRGDGACSRDDCERSHEMPPRVELAKLDLETPLP